MPRNYLKVSPEVMKAHRIRWYAVDPYQPFGEDPIATGHYVPRTSIMRARDQLGWDVICSCGWESRTGGAIEASVRRDVENHRWNEQWIWEAEGGGDTGI